MKTKLTLIALCLNAFLFSQSDKTKLSAYEIYLINSIEYYSNIERNENKYNDLNEEIKQIRDDIKNLYNQTFKISDNLYNQERNGFAICITTVPYLEYEVSSINQKLNIYKKSIELIKRRNLLENIEFKQWFNQYKDFIKKQSGITIDIEQIFNLNSNNVFDFFLSSISIILTNKKSKKDLRESSEKVFLLLNSEMEFYKKFELDIEKKHFELSNNLELLKINIKKFRDKNSELIPTKIIFDSFDNEVFILKINDFFRINNSTPSGIAKIKSEKIEFYHLLNEYFKIKNNFEELNKSFIAFGNNEDGNNESYSESEKVIERQLQEAFFILHKF